MEVKIQDWSKQLARVIIGTKHNQAVLIIDKEDLKKLAKEFSLAVKEYSE